MNDIPDYAGSSGGSRRRWRMRGAGVLVAAAAVALLGTACSGSSPAAAPATPTPATTETATTAPAAPTTAAPTTAAPRTYEAALTYAQCMRAHGAPRWPDPGSDGYFTGNIDVTHSQYLSANAACEHLLPDGGVLSQAQIHQSLSTLSKYAACMRSHGIPGFPDPDPQVVDAGYTWAGYASIGTLHTTAQQFNSASQACRGLQPAYSRAP